MKPLFSSRLVVALYVAFVLMAASGIYLVRTPLDTSLNGGPSQPSTYAFSPHVWRST